MAIRGTYSLICIIGVAGSLAGSGCQSESLACPKVDGVFKAEYLKLGGSCRAACGDDPTLALSSAAGTEFCFKPLEVPFDGGRRGVNRIVQIRPNDTIETSIVMKGCEISLDQGVLKEGNRLQQMVGTVDVMSGNQVGGFVTRREWDASQNVLCEGQYEAVFTKTDITVGGAASF